MFLRRFLLANLRLDTSSLALLAKGVTQNATKKGGMPDACSQGSRVQVLGNVQWIDLPQNATDNGVLPLAGLTR